MRARSREKVMLSAVEKMAERVVRRAVRDAEATVAKRAPKLTDGERARRVTEFVSQLRRLELGRYTIDPEDRRRARELAKLLKGLEKKRCAEETDQTPSDAMQAMIADLERIGAEADPDRECMTRRAHCVFAAIPVPPGHLRIQPAVAVSPGQAILDAPAAPGGACVWEVPMAQLGRDDVHDLYPEDVAKGITEGKILLVDVREPNETEVERYPDPGRSTCRCRSSIRRRCPIPPARRSCSHAARAIVR